jgi:RHS repeat-associated protein
LTSHCKAGRLHQLEEAGLGSLYDYDARFYSSYLNRWIQPDTIVPQPGDPQSLNRFSYVLNNPLKFTDPTGHCIPGEPGCQPDFPAGNLYSINFTTDAGQVWDVRDQNAIFDAARNIASSLRQSLIDDRQTNRFDYRRYGEQLGQIPSSAQIFKQSFGVVTFNRNAGNCAGLGCAAWANNPVNGTIQVYIQIARHGHFSAQNAAHELGHVFDRRAGNDHPSADLAAANITYVNERGRNVRLTTGFNRVNTGYATAGLPWQQHPATMPGGATPGEDFADMFLGWAYNHFATDTAGAARYDWMSTNMAEWIALASH